MPDVMYLAGVRCEGCHLETPGHEIRQAGAISCMSCHGDLGEGDPDLGPRLAGQNSIYVRQQFKAYADSTRQSAQAEIMQSVVAALSDDEIEAVAHYYEQLIRVDKP